VKSNSRAAVLRGSVSRSCTSSFQVREARVLFVLRFYACFGVVLCYGGLFDVVSAWKKC